MKRLKIKIHGEFWMKHDPEVYLLPSISIDLDYGFIHFRWLKIWLDLFWNKNPKKYRYDEY